MRRLRPKHRAGFTLIELSFSLTFYTAIIVVALVAFVGILGVYNKAQSLTRTQNASRIALDAVVRDLRTAKDVRYYELANSTESSEWHALDSDRSTNPIMSATDSLSSTLRANARDYYCISSDAGTRGYANLWLESTNRFVLIRLTQGCNTFTGYEQIVDSDVWTDATALILPGGMRPSQSNDDGGALKRVSADGKDYRGFAIRRVGLSQPAVWEVQVSVYRGTRVPPAQAGFLDQFSAATSLRTVVATRE